MKAISKKGTKLDMTQGPIMKLVMLWAVRIPSAYLIATFIDGHYVSAGVSISFIFGMTASLFYFASPSWKEVRRKADLQKESCEQYEIPRTKVLARGA